VVRAAVVNWNAEVLGRNPREIAYEYEVGGARFTDGYSTLARVPEVGQPIALEVATFAPGWSRVAGSTRNILGWGGLLPLLFAALGAGLLRWSARSRRRETRAFVHGTPVLAKVTFRGQDTRPEYTDAGARGQPMWAITWEYRGPAGDVFRNTVRSADPEDLAPYGAAEEIVVLLDPADPGASAVYFA
jgi:hypothetical protein